MTPQRFHQPANVGHQMGQKMSRDRGEGMSPPPLVSRSAQNFNQAQRGGGHRMPPEQFQQRLPSQNQGFTQQNQGFVHPGYRPAQGVSNRANQSIPGVPNSMHRNVPQMMLKDQSVEENMPGYAAQMFSGGNHSPLGASLNGNMGGPISNDQSVNFDGGISSGIQNMRGGGWGANNGGGERIQGGSGNRGFGQINDPRQMSGFDRNRSANFQQAKTTDMTPIDFVGFNAQGEKIFDVQYYQNTPGRNDIAEFYNQYKKNPDQATMPSNSQQMSEAFLGYQGGDDGIPQGVGYAGIVGETRRPHVESGRRSMEMRGAPLPPGKQQQMQAMQGFRSAPLNHANLANFRGRTRRN